MRVVCCHSEFNYSNDMASKQKRKVLTLNERVEAIKLLDAGRPACKIALDFGAGKTQIQNLRKRKLDILSNLYFFVKFYLLNIM